MFTYSIDELAAMARAVQRYPGDITPEVSARCEAMEQTAASRGYPTQEAIQALENDFSYYCIRKKKK